MVHSNGITANGAAKVNSPSKLAHVVLRTKQFEKMRDFYVTFLGGSITMESPVLCFITYDDEHHRIALINMPHLENKIKDSSGLDHIAFTFDTLPDLLKAYQLRKGHGIDPLWCVNHGPTTSIYYRDPDGNTLETQWDNYETNEGANEFMLGPEFAANPIGVDFDPEDLMKRVESGESRQSLAKRPDIGPRGLEGVPIS